MGLEGWRSTYNTLTSVFTSTGLVGQPSPSISLSPFRSQNSPSRWRGGNRGSDRWPLLRATLARGGGRTQTQAPLPNPPASKAASVGGDRARAQDATWWFGTHTRGKEKVRPKPWVPQGLVWPGALGRRSPIAQLGPGPVFPTSA